MLQTEENVRAAGLLGDLDGVAAMKARHRGILRSHVSLGLSVGFGTRNKGRGT